MASHEFRTPLSTVLSSASLLSKYVEKEDQDKRNRHIDKIRNSVKHLNEILEDFLSLGKLDEGKVESNISEMDLKECILETIDEMRPFLKKDQEIEEFYTGRSVIYSDKKLLRNIVINLISNAIKFSNDGGRITIAVDANDEETEIKVRDVGIGIGVEDQQHLFTSFFRAGNALNIQGTGLGLHIVKRYTDLLGGSLDLNSILDQGTTVTISIPSNYKS